MIFQAFGSALSQLPDRRFLWVVAKSVGLTVLTLVLATLGLQWLVPDTISLPWIGEVSWLGWALDRAVIFAMLAASVFLMIPIASLVIGLFLEAVADAVEDKHYPTHQATSPIGVVEGVRESVVFLALLIGVNIIALIFYLLLPPFAPLIFILVNGILLGREYAQLVAMRHLGRKGANAFRKQNRLTIWVAGMLMAAPLMIPVVNLIIPVLGVATYTHLFHRLNGHQSK
ncbi:MAG: EI24 domain-containing protein [Pseudomonadota bacterium]